MATVRVTKDVCKALICKASFLGDLGECHHLEIATLRLHLGSVVWLLNIKKGSNLEEIGIEAILVSKEAEFFRQQHIQNPPQWHLGNLIYDYLY